MDTLSPEDEAIAQEFVRVLGVDILDARDMVSSANGQTCIVEGD